MRIQIIIKTCPELVSESAHHQIIKLISSFSKPHILNSTWILLQGKLRLNQLKIFRIIANEKHLFYFIGTF